MKKFTVLEKLLIVREFLSGKGGYRYLGRKHNTDKENIRRWVRCYKYIGVSAFINPHQITYSHKTRKKAVLEYLKGGISLGSVCSKYKIAQESCLRRWIKEYNSHKTTSFFGGKSMAKKTTLEERIKIAEFCIKNDYDYKLAATTFSVSYQQARAFTQKYEAKGKEGLIDNRGKNKPEAEMNEVERLRNEIRQLKKQNKMLEMENDVLKKLEEVERRWGLK